ncbi:hypothetical protein BLOT_008699 [Blomia tropicalis]|nr:hypothetical protein BLOT_008699 [Blomia tropicalis]
MEIWHNSKKRKLHLFVHRTYQAWLEYNDSCKKIETFKKLIIFMHRYSTNLWPENFVTIPKNLQMFLKLIFKDIENLNLTSVNINDTISTKYLYSSFLAYNKYLCKLVTEYRQVNMIMNPQESELPLLTSLENSNTTLFSILTNLILTYEKFCEYTQKNLKINNIEKFHLKLSFILLLPLLENNIEQKNVLYIESKVPRMVFYMPDDINFLFYTWKNNLVIVKSSEIQNTITVYNSDSTTTSSNLMLNINKNETKQITTTTKKKLLKEKQKTIYLGFLSSIIILTIITNLFFGNFTNSPNSNQSGKGSNVSQVVVIGGVIFARIAKNQTMKQMITGRFMSLASLKTIPLISNFRSAKSQLSETKSKSNKTKAGSALSKKYSKKLLTQGVTIMQTSINIESIKNWETQKNQKYRV